jgi:hypothetical protein
VVVIAIVAWGALSGPETFTVARGQERTFEPGVVEEGDLLRCVGAPYDSQVEVRPFPGGWQDTSGIAYAWRKDRSLRLRCGDAALV